MCWQYDFFLVEYAKSSSLSTNFTCGKKKSATTWITCTLSMSVVLTRMAIDDGLVCLLPGDDSLSVASSSSELIFDASCGDAAATWDGGSISLSPSARFLLLFLPLLPTLKLIWKQFLDD